MLPRNDPNRIQIAFDDHRLVSNAGLILPSTLALHLGLPQLVDRHLDLGRAPGAANTGDQIMTLVASALAGGDCIDDADGLRAGRTARVLGCVVKAPSTLGTFLRSFRWGHARQLDRVSRELLARAWAAGAGPRSLNNHGPLTIDLDPTICETYGPAKEGARHHGYTGQRGYHPLLAVAAGTGDVLMARLREGRANTARGAAHFLRETMGRVRYAGATGLLTVRADSGFYNHAMVSAGRWTSASPSPSANTRACTTRSRPCLRGTGRPYPTGWTALPTWPRPRISPSGVRLTPRRCGSSSTGCSPRPVLNWPSWSTTAITASSPTGTEALWNWRHSGTGGRSSPPRRDRERHPRPQVRRGTEPSPLRAFRRQVPLQSTAWLAVQVMAHNLAHWAARIGLGEQLVTTKTLRRRFFPIAGRRTRSARRLTRHLPQRWPWENQFTHALARVRAVPLPA